MPQFTVHSPFEPAGDQITAIDKLAEGVTGGVPYQTLKGVTGSGKTFTMAKIIEKVQQPTLVICHNKTLAAQLYRELTDFFPDNAVEYFVSYYDYYQPEAYVPSRDLYIEKDSSINEEIDRLRLRATSSLMQRRDVVIVASVSCIYGLGNPAWFRDLSLVLSRDQNADTQQIARELVRLQYERNDDVLKRGGFRIRGDVIDIYPAYLNEALRVELNWDVIEKLRRFHPVSGEVLDEPEEFTLYPAKHFVLPEEKIRAALDDIREELKTQYAALLKENKLVEAQRLKSRTEYDLEMLDEMGYCSGIENYSRHLSGRKEGERPSCLIDYFPDDFLTFIDESHITLSQIGAMYEGDRSRKLNLVNYGFRLPSALDNRPLYFGEFEGMLSRTVFVSATPGKEELRRSGQVVEQIIRPTGLIDPEVEIRPTQGQIEHLYGEIRKRIDQDERTLVTTLTKKMAEDLSAYFAEMGLKVQYLHSEVDTLERVEILKDLRLGNFDVIVGINLLREGLDLPEVSLVAILDADKIGFLRSATSLIQTIGRAARNVNGKVIMYADKRSAAMDEAIRETEYRREVQQQYNIEHGIEPQTIRKAVQDIIERRKTEKQEDGKMSIQMLKDSHNLLIPKERKKLIKLLKEQMLEHAKNLEFEQAAVIRDEIETLESGKGS